MKLGLYNRFSAMSLTKSRRGSGRAHWRLNSVCYGRKRLTELLGGVEDQTLAGCRNPAEISASPESRGARRRGPADPWLVLDRVGPVPGSTAQARDSACAAWSQLATLFQDSRRFKPSINCSTIAALKGDEASGRIEKSRINASTTFIPLSAIRLTVAVSGIGRLISSVSALSAPWNSVTLA